MYGFQDLVQLRVAFQLRDDLSLQALRRLKKALDVDAPFAVVVFGRTASGEVVYLGPEGHHEAAKAPGQITMTFNVPLKEIRSDLNERIGRLRRRRGVGKIESSKGILSGQARVKGTRISAAAVARLVAAGWSTERILEEYPGLRPADIAAVKAQAEAG